MSKHALSYRYFTLAERKRVKWHWARVGGLWMVGVGALLWPWIIAAIGRI